MQLKNRKKRLSCFTLLELIVSMGVFAILMLALMQFFTSAQSIWTRSNTRYDMYDNARLALNLMAADLQCLYYDDYKADVSYFTVRGNDDKWTLSMATQRSDSSSSSACTNLTLVYYQYSKEDGTLKFKQVTDYEVDEADRKDNKTPRWITCDSKSNVLGVWESLGTWSVLAENIVSFPKPVCQYLPQAGTGEYVIDTPDNPPNKIPIPQRVILSMTLIESEAWNKLKAFGIENVTGLWERLKKLDNDITNVKTLMTSSKDNTEINLAKQSIQTFVQAVSIDR